MGKNGADFGIEPTRKQGKILPMIFGRQAKPYTDRDGNIQAFAVLASKNTPPEGWMVSTPSRTPGKRWFWIFLAFALLVAPLVLR